MRLAALWRPVLVGAVLFGSSPAGAARSAPAWHASSRLSLLDIAPSRMLSPTARPALLEAPPSPPALPICRLCGIGVPDARLTPHLRLGADTSNLVPEALRLSLKLDRAAPPASLPRGRELELGVDVGRGSGGIVLGIRF